MVRLHRINLKREQLDRIPENERRLLVLIAHAGNELNVLAKLFHFAAASAAEEGVLGQAENAQALVLARTLTGKIYEFWKLLQSSFFGPALSKQYERELDDVARTSLAALKRYFGRDNLIDTVRNKFAFHYSPDQIDAGYKSVIESDPLQVYLAKENVNTLYAFADTITGRAMLEAILPGDHQGAFKELIDQTSAAVGNINTIIGALMVVCFKKYVGDSLYVLGADIIEIEGAPDSQKIKIPYFIEVPRRD